MEWYLKTFKSLNRWLFLTRSVMNSYFRLLSVLACKALKTSLLIINEPLLTYLLFISFFDCLDLAYMTSLFRQFLISSGSWTTSWFACSRSRPAYLFIWCYWSPKKALFLKFSWWMTSNFSSLYTNDFSHFQRHCRVAKILLFIFVCSLVAYRVELPAKMYLPSQYFMH